MKLNDLIIEIRGGSRIRRGRSGPYVALNPAGQSLWYYHNNGDKLFPITFGDSVADDWEIYD
jgi:hypothetical protein